VRVCVRALVFVTFLHFTVTTCGTFRLTKMVYGWLAQTFKVATRVFIARSSLSDATAPVNMHHPTIVINVIENCYSTVAELAAPDETVLHLDGFVPVALSFKKTRPLLRFWCCRGSYGEFLTELLPAYLPHLLSVNPVICVLSCASRIDHNGSNSPQRQPCPAAASVAQHGTRTLPPLTPKAIRRLSAH
jgi:hypothetical protein